LSTASRVSELGTKVDPDCAIRLDAVANARQAERVTILLHKPVGYVSGQPEPGYQPAVTLIRPESLWQDGRAGRAFHPTHLKGLAPAGRLDIDSTGLLVLTQDGRIAKQLIGDDSGVEKEYLVRVEGRLDEKGLALLNHGLSLDGRKIAPGAGRLAERRPAALHAEGRPQAPDPPHVRAGGPESGGAQTRAHRPRAAGRAAAGAMALSARRRGILKRGWALAVLKTCSAAFLGLLITDAGGQTRFPFTTLQGDFDAIQTTRRTVRRACADRLSKG
jgi:hypothetical protein